MSERRETTEGPGGEVTGEGTGAPAASDLASAVAPVSALPEPLSDESSAPNPGLVETGGDGPPGAEVAAEALPPSEAGGEPSDPAEAAAWSGETDQAVGAPSPPPPDPALVEEALRIAEAVLFASDKPVPAAKLQAVLPEGTEAPAILAELAARCAGRGVELVEVAGGFAFRTAADLAPRLTKVVEAPRRLPRAAMEALAIIAYHQPCTRGEIEEIRGASLAQTTLEALLELGLIAPRGKKEASGRPTLWGTTPRFLEQFGLKSLKDLPRREELVAPEGPMLPLSPPETPRQPEPPGADPPSAAP